MDKFLDTYDHPKLNQEDINSINRSIKSNEIEASIQMQRKVQDMTDSLLNSTQKTRYSRKTCTQMFAAALFTIAKLWKQPRCSTSEEWIKKLWYIYRTKYYSATRHTNMGFEGK
jgi:hypothetical protein